MHGSYLAELRTQDECASGILCVSVRVCVRVQVCPYVCVCVCVCVCMYVCVCDSCSLSPSDSYLRSLAPRSLPPCLFSICEARYRKLIQTTNARGGKKKKAPPNSLSKQGPDKISISAPLFKRYQWGY